LQSQPSSDFERAAVARALFARLHQQMARGADIEQNRAQAFENRFHSVIDTICSRKLAEKKAETLRQRLLDPNREYDRLFTFLKYPDVQPTNN
jgi:hypothetical protein